VTSPNDVFHAGSENCFKSAAGIGGYSCYDLGLFDVGSPGIDRRARPTARGRIDVED